MSTPGDPPPDPPADEPTPAEPSAGIGRPFESIGAPDAALADAVGIQPRRKRLFARRDRDPDADGEPGALGRNKLLMGVIAGTLIVGIGIAVVVLLGRVNAERYVLDCTTNAAVAKQGRAFPPWGEAALRGAEWRPIPLPANAQCKSEELSQRSALEAKYLDLLLERASATLSAHDFVEALGESKGAVLDSISAQLEQALLLSRSPDRGDQRKQVERLQGDVGYWRATLRLRDATAALAEAAKQFDAAALLRPMHVSDAGAWAEFLRRLADELHAGPAGTAPATLPAPDTRTPAPQGSALPVEESPSGSDAPASPPDAGLPTGGVLL